MEWALTAFVLCSVSLLVVTLTMEHGGHALHHHRSSITLGRSSLLRFLLAARALASRTGHHLGSAGRAGGSKTIALAVAAGQAMRATIEGLWPHVRRFASTKAFPGRPKNRALKFEECLLMTGPGQGVTSTVTRSTLSLAPIPAPTSWLSRVVTVFELVVVIAMAGGAIALALIAAGWKAARFF